VAGAHPGQGYKYPLVTQDTVLERIDPYAREVTHSSDCGVIHDSAFDWDDDDFVLPPHNELVIYEMYIGSFNPDSDSQPGGFSQAADKLGYLKHVGVNAVQVMPVAEFAGDYSWDCNPPSIAWKASC